MPVVKAGGKVTFKRRPKAGMKGVDLIIIDEISMISTELLKDLEWFGVPILAFGDFEQLPPVGGSAAMKQSEAAIRLTEVHRQALQSDVLRYARALIGKGTYEPSVGGDLEFLTYDDLTKEVVLSHDIVICGTNAMRIHYNREVRKILGHDGVLNPGESIIILRNSPEHRMYNGEIYTVEKVEPYRKRADVLAVWVRDSLSQELTEIRIPKYLFTNEPVDSDTQRRYNQATMRGNLVMATYGYVITCHKSQGSTFDKVLVLDESEVFGDMETNWLYTAVTRAATKCTIVREWL
jgi:exodeoxyribonuclease-5